jgi:WD40 repeat protein
MLPIRGKNLQGIPLLKKLFLFALLLTMLIVTACDASRGTAPALTTTSAQSLSPTAIVPTATPTMDTSNCVDWRDGDIRATAQNILYHNSSDNGYIQAVAWSPDGMHVAIGRYDGLILIIDAHSGKQLTRYRKHMVGEVNPIYNLAWSPDGSRILSTSINGDFKIWNPQTDETLVSRSVDRVVSAQWSHDGSRIAYSVDRGNGGWNGYGLYISDESGNILLDVSGTDGVVQALDWSPNDQYLAVADYSAAEIISTTSWQIVASYPRPQEAVDPSQHPPATGVSWAPDSKHLALLNNDTGVIWNTATGSITELDDANSIAWSTRNQIAEGSMYSLVSVVTPAGEIVSRLQTCDPGPYGLLPVRWSPDGKHIAINNGDSLYVWNS